MGEFDQRRGLSFEHLVDAHDSSCVDHAWLRLQSKRGYHLAKEYGVGQFKPSFECGFQN
jgi:hypothetical protein